MIPIIIKIRASFILLFLYSCNLSLNPSSSLMRHGINQVHFRELEENWKKMKTPFSLYACMRPLTIQEAGNIVSNNSPETKQNEFLVYNNLSRGSIIYRFELSSEERLTEKEFIEIATGDKQSEIRVAKIHQDFLEPLGGTIIPPKQ